MGQKLFISSAERVTKLLNNLQFKTHKDGSYKLDDRIMEHLDIQEECPEDHRPVAVHILPYTVVEGEIIYYAFNSLGAPTLYVSFQITPEDFVSTDKTAPYLSFCRTIVGKIVRTLDAPAIDLNVDMSRFLFPAVIEGEFIWAMEVKGDDHHTVDELVGQLGTVLGRITRHQVLHDDIEVNALSKAAVKYKAPADNLTI